MVAMEGDAETLKRDGFVIVRGCVAPADLDAARATWEALLDRQREARPLSRWTFFGGRRPLFPGSFSLRVRRCGRGRRRPASPPGT